MRPIWLTALLLLGLAFQASGVNNIGSLPERRVVTAGMIRDAGLIRIGDLLLLAEEWTINTTDGYTWRASVNGLSSFQDQTWIVMLDGQRVDLRTFDTVHLNILPVSLDQIDSVEVISLPQIHGGEFTDRGLIHIHTKKPAPGISLLGRLVTGNETGDPGPYQYTEYRTPNIDKIGLDESVAVDIGAKNWSARAYLLYQLHTFTDFAMQKRITTMMHDWPGMDRIAGACRIGRESMRGNQEFLVSYSYASEYPLFFKPLGREIPVKIIFPHIGMSGTLLASRNTDVAYQVKYSLNKLGKNPNALDFDFDWVLHNLNAYIEGTFRKPGYRRMAGIGLDRYALETQYRLKNDSYTTGKVYGELYFRLTTNIHQGISAMLAVSNERAAVKGALTNRWNTPYGHQVKTVITWSQRLIEEENSLWYWAERGYDLLNDYGINDTIVGDVGTSEQFTGDVIWTANISKTFTMKASGSYRLFTGLSLERQPFEYNPQDCSFSSPAEIYGERRGQTIGVSITINHHPRPYLRQRLYYSYRTIPGGDELFKQTWASIPKHKASYQITYTPVQNFSLWAMFSYLSSSSWADYQNIDGQTCRLSRPVDVSYYSSVRGATVLDLQAQKWFWHRRLAGSLLLRNVWNQDFRYHPIGASFDLSFFVRVKVLLNCK